MISTLAILLSGCVIEEGLEEDDPMGGSLSGAEVIVGGDELGGESIGAGVMVGGETAGTVMAGDDSFVVDMTPPVEPCDPDIIACDPDSVLNLRTCECEPIPICDCPAVYDPICGQDNRTYGNECEIDCAGQEVAYFGECEGSYFECFEPNPEVMYISDDPYECEYIDFACPDNAEYYYDDCGCGCYVRDCNAECVGAPRESVCTPDGERFSSECQAICEGAYSYRACESSCECPEIYAPECGLDGNTYNNSCLRECLGVPLSYEGECNAGEWLCQDDRAWDDCDLACAELTGCFMDQCSMEEMGQLSASCARLCQDWGADGICSFGSCFEAPWLFLEFQDLPEPIACLEGAICPDEFEGAEYVSFDPDSCRLIGEIDCGDRESFSGPCGCGCMGNACLPEDQARYVSRDLNVCERISIDCPVGSEVFSDDCGCGCRY